MVDYEDDETITDDTLLLRRIPSKPNLNIVWDGNSQKFRPSSASFEDHPNGSPMSVVLSDTLEEENRLLESALYGFEKEFSLSAFTAGLARECSQAIVRDPVPEESAHGLVVGNKSRGVRKKLARESFWIVEPEID